MLTDSRQEDTVLTIDGVSKSFPGVNALTNMTLDLKRAEVHAICGENGAGKSTLMKIITGIYKPDRGKMVLNGEILDIDNPNQAYERGIAIIFQETSLFPDLTVLENLFMGHEIKKPLIGKLKFISILDYSAMRKKAEEILGRLGMSVDLDAKVANLGVAKKQMVEIAKALTFDSQILILDEPTAALTSNEVDTLFETIGRLKSHGVSMLYISHRLDEIFQVADRVTVIRDGEHIHTEEVSKVTKDELVSWMVGRVLNNFYPKEDVKIGDVILEARGIIQLPLLDGIDLQLRRGEILGLSGLAGSGRTELALALCGLTKLDGGSISIDGKPKRLSTYREALENGIVYISEDRQKYGLIIPMSISENITLPLLRRISKKLGIIDFQTESKINDEYMKKLGIKAPSGSFIVNNLSGGNQQKVSVAKALATTPRILILDEPTRGVDVGAKSEIHHIISDLAKEGKSIIMISSELPEIIGMSDRVIVMKNGSKMGELSRSELSQERILQLAL
jgi:ABC-type sugar transport system ATPase subunit